MSGPPPAPPPTTVLEVLSTPSKSTKNFNSNDQCLLPRIDPSSTGTNLPQMRSETQSLSRSSDFLPSELLIALKRQENPPEFPPLGGTKLPSRYLSPKNPPPRSAGETVRPPIKPPANLWSYPHRREKLKHLINAPPCVCGAGRDISFLYDPGHREKKETSRKVCLFI